MAKPLPPPPPAPTPNQSIVSLLEHLVGLEAVADDLAARSKEANTKVLSITLGSHAFGYRQAVLTVRAWAKERL